MNAGLPLDRFDDIDLGRLVADAALQTRIDRKYVLTRDDAARVVAGLDRSTRVLDTDGVRAFRYESVYFDTPDLLSFRMAAQPRRRRFKLRTRTYLDSRTAFLELKTRGARSATVKDRVEYAASDRRVLTDAARDYAAEGMDAIGVGGRRADDLGARLTTRYRRATFVSSDSAARATLDVDLEWHDVDGAVLAKPRLAIFETKSGAAASGFDRALWHAGHRPVSISKYATGMAALHPDLPRNRWARLLRGPFSAGQSAAPLPSTRRSTPTEESSCADAA